MSKRSLLINKLIRKTNEGESEELVFSSGVNVIIGAPGTGKSQWLKMLDYLWGKDAKAEKAFDAAVANKYNSIEAHCKIGEIEYIFSRRWDEAKSRRKVYVNDEEISVTEFSDKMLELLEYPIIDYPKGSPYGSKKWPSLSWRTLYRHMYRRTWGNQIIDQQVDSEFHACVAYFLGLAPILFSEEFAKQVSLTREIEGTQQLKENFFKILKQVTNRLKIDQEDLGDVTPLAIQEALSRVDQLIENDEAKREEILKSLQEEVLNGEGSINNSIFEELNTKIFHLDQQEIEASHQCQQTKLRLKEYQDYYSSVKSEISRLERALSAEKLFAEFKITHCPACDRLVEPPASNDTECHVCHQSFDENSDEEAGRARLEFELIQLQAELKEAKDLLGQAEKDINKLESSLENISRSRDKLNAQLRPVQKSAVTIMPPEITILDTRIGQLQAKKEQIERIKDTLGYRDVLNQQITELEDRLEQFKAKVKVSRKGLDFASVSDYLTGGMNDYFRLLKKYNTSAWLQKEAKIKVTQSNVTFSVGEESWKHLSSSQSQFYLLAYNFALLGLSNESSYFYPGILILDLPAKFDVGKPITSEEDSEDKSDVNLTDGESIAIQPFIDLLSSELSSEENPTAQVIVAGNSLSEITGKVNKIYLHDVWPVG